MEQPSRLSDLFDILFADMVIVTPNRRDGSLYPTAYEPDRPHDLLDSGCYRIRPAPVSDDA